MRIDVVTLFPEMFEAVAGYGITGRAVKTGLVSLRFWNPRDYTSDRHQTVDDKPYGGGPGMLMKVAPLQAAIQAAKAGAAPGTEVMLLSPQGKPLRQADFETLAGRQQLILVAGRYEGIDERLIELEIDREVSVGDYVLSGGELPAMVVIDGVTRLQPGAVGDDASVVQESFNRGLLDYPQYTRPVEIDGRQVPPVLLSGNHGEIERWRRQQAIRRTLTRRPDLLESVELTADELRWLEKLRASATNEDET